MAESKAESKSEFEVVDKSGKGGDSATLNTTESSSGGDAFSKESKAAKLGKCCKSLCKCIGSCCSCLYSLAKFMLTLPLGSMTAVLLIFIATGLVLTGVRGVFYGLGVEDTYVENYTETVFSVLLIMDLLVAGRVLFFSLGFQRCLPPCCLGRPKEGAGGCLKCISSFVFCVEKFYFIMFHVVCWLAVGLSIVLLIFITLVFALIYAYVGACTGAEEGKSAIVDALNSDPINAGLAEDDDALDAICDKKNDMGDSANVLMAGAVMTLVAQIMILVFFATFAAKVEAKIDAATTKKDDGKSPAAETKESGDNEIV